MTITNKLQLPIGLVKAVSTERHNEVGCISATTLIQGIKQILLTQRHWEELQDDVSDRIWAVFGTAVHSLLENEGEYDFTEIEMKADIAGITLTGRIDNYNMQDGIVCDYKTSSVYKVKSKDFDDWYLQGMIYAWLLKRNNLPVNKCKFIAMLKDFSKNEALRSSEYPQKPVFIYEFDVSKEKLESIEQYIMDKINTYIRWEFCKDDDIPECSAHERWEKKPIFAVKKQGRKTAIRLFDTEDSANLMVSELGKNHYVEFRQGESVRCQSYCVCSEFCNYYKQMIETQNKLNVA